MNYDDSLQRSLDNICYRDSSRDILSVEDTDVLQIFSGDTQAAERGLRVFFDRHYMRGGRETGKVEILFEKPLTLKVFSLFPDPAERVQKDTHRKRMRRFREGRWPEQRPYRRGQFDR
jgi:hypothetical protein